VLGDHRNPSAGLPLRSDDPIGVGRCQRHGFLQHHVLAGPQGGDREIRPCAARSTIDHGVDLAVREHRTQVVGRDHPVPGCQRCGGGRVTADHHPQTSAVTQLGQRAGVDLGDHPGPDDREPQRFGHDISSHRRFRSLTDDEAAATLKTPCAP